MNNNRDYFDTGDELVNEIVKRRYTDEGVVLLKENNVGGVWSCTWKVKKWGESTDIAPCANCGRMHPANEPALCFDCRFG
jgi:hypothetical protein